MNKSNRYQILDYIFMIAVIGFCFYKYKNSMAPGLLTGDGAEFQVLSQQLGLAHAMGYPVYLLAGKLFSFLPINELPWRINLLSVVSASLSLGALYLIARFFTRHQIIALAAPFALGLTGLFWKNSIVAEVYSPSTLVSNLIILLVLVWSRHRNNLLLIAAGFLGGIAFGIHSMITLLGPAIIIYMIIQRACKKEWLSAAVGVIAGGLILLGAYYWLAVRDPVTDNIRSVILPNISRYGMTASDLDTPLKRMFFIMTAQQFGGTLFTLPFNQVMSNMKSYFPHLIDAVGLIWSCLAFFGMIAIFIPNKSSESRWKHGILLFLSMLILIFIPANYAIRTDIVVLFITSYTLVAVLAVIGLDSILNQLFRLIPIMKNNLGELTGWLIRTGIQVFVLWFIIMTFTKILDMSHAQPREPIKDSLSITYADIQWTTYYTAREWAENIIKQVDNDGIIFTEWKIMYGIQYVAIVQKERPGLIVIEKAPFPGGEGLVASELEIIDKYYGSRPIYFTKIAPELEIDYRFISVGGEPSIYRLEKK